MKGSIRVGCLCSMVSGMAGNGSRWWGRRQPWGSLNICRLMLTISWGLHGNFTHSLHEISARWACYPWHWVLRLCIPRWPARWNKLYPPLLLKKNEWGASEPRHPLNWDVDLTLPPPGISLTSGIFLLKRKDSVRWMLRRPNSQNTSNFVGCLLALVLEHVWVLSNYSL